MITDTITDVINLILGIFDFISFPVSPSAPAFFARLNDYTDSLVTFLSYVNYFVPLSAIMPIIALSFSLLVTRILFAIVNLIYP